MANHPEQEHRIERTVLAISLALASGVLRWHEETIYASFRSLFFKQDVSISHQPPPFKIAGTETLLRKASPGFLVSGAQEQVRSSVKSNTLLEPRFSFLDSPFINPEEISSRLNILSTFLYRSSEHGLGLKTRKPRL